jgi:cell division protein FtsQ
LATSVETAERGVTLPPLLPPARRGLRSAWTLAAACVALLLALAFVVSRSGIFALTSLHVQGTHHLSRQDVVRLAGLEGSPNVLWLSTAGVDRRLLDDPWIASADVTRALPSAVSITVRERIPVAVATDPSGRTFLVASDAVILGPAAADAGLPALLPASTHALAPGQRLTAGPALAVASAFGPGLAAQVTSVQVGEAGVDVQLRSGVRVLYGDATDLGAKAGALAAVLAWSAQHDVTPSYVDVRAPSAPALLPSPPAGQATPSAPATPAASTGPSPEQVIGPQPTP